MANSDLRSYLNIMSNGESDRLSYVNNAAYEDNSLSIARLNNLLKRQNLTNRAKENITNYNEQLQKLKEQNRSGWQKFWDTLNEVSSNVWTGLFSGFDAIGDLGITIGSWFTDDDSWATNAKNYDWVSQASNAMTQFGQVTSGSDLFTGDIFQDNYTDRWDTINSVQESQRQLQTLYDNSLLNYFGDGFHDFVKDLGTTIGQMAPAIGLSFIPGAGPALGLAYMGLVAGGRELSDTYDETGDIWTSIKKGALSAGVEVATELFVGKGLAKLGVGTGKLFGIAGKGTSTAKQSISKTLAKSMFEEGTEEAVSGLVSPLVDALAYEDTSYLSQYGNKEFWYSGDESLVRQFALGAASAGVLGGGNAVINTSRYGIEGYKARLAYESIYEDYEDLKKIKDRNSSRYRKAQEKLAQDSIDFIDFLDKTKAKSTNSSNAKAQYDNLIRDMTRGISNQISLDDRYERIVNQINTDPNKQSANLLVNELNNMFQNDVKVQFVSEEELGSGNTASFDRATRTISINENYSDEFASKIAHEYIGHAVLENINSETRTKLLNDIKKTDYYKNNIEKISQAYGDTDVLEEEIIANYIESELTSLNEINNTFLNKSILRKAINLFDKAFIRNTDKAVLDSIVDVVNKVGSISTINNKIALNVPLNKKERLFYNNHKDYFNYVKNNVLEETYSKNFENVEGINLSDKDSAIETINKIINGEINSNTFVEFENNDFNGLKALISNKLPFVNLDLPVTMQVSKLKKVVREFNDEKHYHGLTAENIYDAITNLNNPEMILQNRNNSQNITFITSIEIRQNEKATIGFTFNFTNKPLNALTNNVDTIFGMNAENYNLYLKSKNNRKGDYNILFKKGSRLAPIAPTTSLSTNNLHQENGVSQDESVKQNLQNEVDNIKEREVNYQYERTNDFRRLQEESRRLLKEFESGTTTYQQLDANIRERYIDSIQRALESGRNSNSYDFRVLNSSKGSQFTITDNINSRLFHDAFETIKPYLRQNELVDLHDNYDNCKCFLSEDGLQGFAIEENGNLVSVFNADESKRGFVDAISSYAKENGATHLDCYGYLANYYNKVLGFKVASMMDYNMEYDHHNIAKNYNSPQVAFMVNTTEEVETKHFNKDQYDEAQEYQLSFVNKNIKYSKDLDKIQDNIVKEYENIKIGENGKITRYEITEPLFEIANDSIKIAKENFDTIKKDLFTDIANKYNLSLEITDINGNKLDDPSIKSLSSFADRLYRNAIGKGINPNQVKDWVRGTFIFNDENIPQVKNVIEDLRPYLKKIDIKNKKAYKAIHLNLNCNEILVEIQLHTNNSWKLKTDEDVNLYDKWRSIPWSKMTDEQKAEYKANENYYDEQWNQILEERDFKALRAEVSSVNSSISSSLGSNSQPYTSLTGETHEPLTYSSKSSSANEPLNNLPVGVNTNRFSSTSNTSTDNIILEQEELNIEPFETNKAKKIKDYANQRLGKVISLTDTSKVYNQIIDYIYANFGASVKNVNSKVRALFEEYNVVTDYSYNDFAKDLLNSEITNSNILIGEETQNYTLRDYLNEQGINTDELETDLASLLEKSLDAKANISDVTKLFNRLDEKLFKAVNRIQELKNYAKNYAKLSSKIKNLRDQLKLPNNFDIDIQDEASALKYLISGRVFTRNGGISGTYRTRLHKLMTEGYFDKIINNTNFNEFEDFGEAINIFKDLANTYDESRGNNQKILSVSEGEQLIAAYSKIVKTLQEYKNGAFSEIINVATRSANEQIIVNNAKRNLPFTNKLKGFVHKIINPLSVFGTEFGGKDSYLYKQTIQKAVDAYVNEQLDEATLQRKFNDTLTKKSILLKDQNKNVKFRNYNVPRYNLYALYLNANSINYEDLLEQGFILKGLRNKNEPHLDFNEEVLAEVNELLTNEEMTELNKVSDFLNNELKEYVRKAQINDIGYSTMMDNGIYYPKFTDRGTLNKQLNDPNQPDFMIDASAWNSLKLRTGRKTRIELNNPISVVNSYITSASRYANLTNAQRTINRVFNKKFETPIDGYTSLRDMIKQTSGSDLLMHLTSFMNKLQGNNVRRSSEFIDKWGGRFATATLGINISSTLKQIGSLPTTANKTGILNQLKSLVNFDTYKIRENYNYLVEHNGLFAMRVLNHGYANSQIFLNDVSRLSNRYLNKIIDYTQLPLEMADSLWCIMSFSACKQQAFNEFNGKYDINSEEVMTRANTLFNDILLETQSNAYAISTSMLRSGEMGSFARWIFGTFASDSQNKLSLLYESIYNYVNNNRVIQNLNNELNNNLDLSEDTKNAYRDMLNARINNKSKLSIAMYRNAYTLTASALLTFAASLLARWLLNKDKEEDYEVENLATNFAKELFIDWIPFISTISSNFEYNEGKFEAMPLENASRLLNDLYSMISSLTEGNGFDRTVLFTLIRDLAQFYGLPVTNFFNITNGVIEKFSPEVAFNMNNFLYGYSQSYIEKTQNDSLEKGYFKTGKLYLNQNITLFKTGELNSAIINELATLKNKGFNAIPKNYMTSYTDENGNEILLTDLEMNTFKNYYNEVNDEALNLIRSSEYKKLDDEGKAKALKKLFDYYYDYAKNMTLEETEGSRLVKLMSLINNFSISDYLLLKEETKEKTLSNVNKIFSSRNEKLLALYLVGYNLTDENKEIVYRYLLSKGLTRSAAKEFMGLD